ncbi:MAG: hypothetical protein FWE69_02840 [Clostridiales bacterium]|nr:hypothetical protein [Clostridiales bacterium]
MEYTELMRVLDRCLDQRQEIIICWNDDLVIKSTGNTGVFETTNCLDLEDENFFEYYACAVYVSDILHAPQKDIIKPEFGSAEIGKFIEISELNEPTKIETTDGTVLWEKDGQ